MVGNDRRDSDCAKAVYIWPVFVDENRTSRWRLFICRSTHGWSGLPVEEGGSLQDRHCNI
jgi:hypothetical protein